MNCTSYFAWSGNHAMTWTKWLYKRVEAEKHVCLFLIHAVHLFLFWRYLLIKCPFIVTIQYGSFINFIMPSLLLFLHPSKQLWNILIWSTHGPSNWCCCNSSFWINTQHSVHLPKLSLSHVWHQLVLKNIVGIMAFLNVFAVKLSLVAENVLCPAKP